MSEQKPPIVMIHGMYATGRAWENWKGFFERAGFVVHTPTLRHHEVDPAAPVPPELGALSISAYMDDLTKLIDTLPQKPILFGHSMGGLISQLLAARGKAAAAVLVTPAAPAGINALKLKPTLVFMRVLSRWAFWRKPHHPTRRSADFGTFNKLDRATTDIEYGRFVHESGRALFEIAYWWLDRKHTTRVEFDKMPCDLLFLAGSEDNTIVPSVCRATASRYGRRASYIELKGHAHWPLGEPGWEKVAQEILAWLQQKKIA